MRFDMLVVVQTHFLSLVRNTNFSRHTGNGQIVTYQNVVVVVTTNRANGNISTVSPPQPGPDQPGQFLDISGYF